MKQLILAFAISFLMQHSVVAKDITVPCSRVKARDGSIIVFYPLSVPESTVRSVAEGPLHSWSLDCRIELPQSYVEVGEHVDKFLLPTEQGPDLVIRQEYSWGKSIGLRIEGPLEPPVVSVGGSTVVYILRTISGPPVEVQLAFQRGRVVGCSFRLQEESEYPGPDFVKLPTVKDAKDPIRVFDAISEVAYLSDQMAFEKFLFQMGKQILPTILDKLSDRDPRVRESACVLARWFPDATIVERLAELLVDTSPRVAREARYSLNILLLQEGNDVDSDDTKRELAIQMLGLFLQELYRNPNYDWRATNYGPRRAFLTADEIFVLPHNIPEIHDHEVTTKGLAFNVIGKIHPSPSIRFRFLDKGELPKAAREEGFPAVHFHRIKIFGDFARVALSALHKKDQHWEMNWVALFRKNQAGWKVLAFPPYNEKFYLGRNFSNMYLLVPRGFGGLSPVDFERFQFGIERIRTIDVFSKRLVELDNFLFRWVDLTRGLDERYVNLLCQYLDDENPAVRYAVLIALGKLGTKDVIVSILDMCMASSNLDIEAQCRKLIKELLVSEIISKGTPPTTYEMRAIMFVCKQHIVEKRIRRYPEEPMKQSKVLVYGDYGFVELAWEFRGIELLCRKQNGKWEIVMILGEWVI